MQTVHPTISIVLDTRHATKKNLYPVKLRATFRTLKGSKKISVQKYFNLKNYCTEVDFKAATTSDTRKQKTKAQNKIRQVVVEAEGKANNILKAHKIITVDLFTRLFTSSSKLEAVGTVFDLKIAELEKEGKVGTADLYSAVKNSLPEELTFDMVTPNWIREYAKGRNATTAAIYLRHLRAIYNKAIHLKIITAETYPFGRAGYMIKKTKARKIALSEADKNRLIKVTDKSMRWAIDMWMMSYYCYGLNMTDIASLKVKDLKDDVLIISRAKTSSELIIPVRQEVKAIIARHGNKTLNPNDYVFPVLSPDLTARQIKNRVKDFTKAVNDGLDKVQKKLKLEISLTTYTARHTFAMMALRKGASKEFIQDALGHSSIMTTESYLSGFDVEAKRAISNKL